MLREMIEFNHIDFKDDIEEPQYDSKRKRDDYKILDEFEEMTKKSRIMTQSADTRGSRRRETRREEPQRYDIRRDEDRRIRHDEDRRIRHDEDRRGRHDDDHRGRDEDRHSRHGDDRNMRRDETRSRKEDCNEIEIYIDSKRLYDFICQTIVDDDIVSKKILKNNKKFKIKFEGRRLERSENKIRVCSIVL